jgi:hypothetical protein
MTVSVKVWRQTYLVSAQRRYRGVCVCQDLNDGNGGAVLKGSRYVRKDGTIADTLDPHLPRRVMDKVEELWDNWAPRLEYRTHTVTVSSARSSHCFYCGARIRDGKCPGCEATDWDRHA